MEQNIHTTYRCLTTDVAVDCWQLVTRGGYKGNGTTKQGWRSEKVLGGDWWVACNLRVASDGYEMGSPTWGTSYELWLDGR